MSQTNLLSGEEGDGDGGGVGGWRGGWGVVRVVRGRVVRVVGGRVVRVVGGEVVRVVGIEGKAGGRRVGLVERRWWHELVFGCRVSGCGRGRGGVEERERGRRKGGEGGRMGGDGGRMGGDGGRMGGERGRMGGKRGKRHRSSTERAWVVPDDVLFMHVAAFVRGLLRLLLLLL